MKEQLSSFDIFPPSLRRLWRKKLERARVHPALLPQFPDWSRPRWITDELVMEEARRRERAGEGRVEDDGQPPARWVPKESE